MVKVYQLREKDEKALVEELNKLKAELAKARIGKVAAAATQVKASKIKVLSLLIFSSCVKALQRY